METKCQHTRGLLTEKAHCIIELFFEFAQQKNIYRKGWRLRGVSKLECESDADHSFNVALLGYLIAEEYRPDLDSGKVMKLGLFHDLGEIYAGDLTPSDGVSLEDKSAREYAAIQKVFSNAPNPDKYVNIWLEYDKGDTPEANFVRQVDQLEMALQANLYERINYKGLDDFFPYVEQRISSPELKEIFSDLLKIR